MRGHWRERGARIRAEAAGLLAWWLEELRACGEGLLGRIAPRFLTRTVIELEEAGGRIFTVRGKDRQEVLVFTCEVPGAWPEDLERFGSVAPLQGTRAVATLAPEFALAHHIVLPRTLEREVDEVIPLQLERELPVPADRVALDWRILPRPRPEPRITVELLVVHRAVVERVKSLARALGVELVRVGLSHEGSGVRGNFLRASHRMSPLRLTATERRLALSAGALAALWGLLIGGQWLYERARVDRVLKEATPHAVHVDRLREQLSAEAAPGASLAALMREPDALDVLTALTEAVPKDSWAYEVDISAQAPRSAEIKASTFTPTASMLVDLLGRSPQFEHVQLVSSRSAGLFAGDRLTLTAHWAPPSATMPSSQATPQHLATTGGRHDRS